MTSSSGVSSKTITGDASHGTPRQISRWTIVCPRRHATRATLRGTLPKAMARPETLSAPEGDVAAGAGAGALGRRHALRRGRDARGAPPAPDGGARASRPALRGALRRRRVDRRHVRDPRAPPRRRRRASGPSGSSGTSASTRRCTPGLSRARGEIVVTMDGDLQNPPEDVPRLVEAVEAGYDVASGRRAARHDSWGRTLPSRLINGMLRRFTGVAISDFGCAFNAYRRERRRADARRRSAGRSSRRRSSSPAARRSSRSTSATPRAGLVALLAAAPHAARAARARGFLAAADPVRRRRARRRLLARVAPALGDLRHRVLDRPKSNFPGPLLLGALVVAVLGVQGFILALVGEHLGRIQRVVEHRPSTSSTESSERGEARTRHRRRRVHPVEPHPAPARAHAARGHLARRAHVCRQPREPRRRDEPSAARVRARRHP